jgi:hypothetical protein
MQGKTNKLFDRLRLPTRIIVNRSALTAAGLAEAIQKGEYAPDGGETCELAAGGQVLARGRIVRRRGRYFFKVLETAKEERT